MECERKIFAKTAESGNIGQLVEPGNLNGQKPALRRQGRGAAAFLEPFIAEHDSKARRQHVDGNA